MSREIKFRAWHPSNKMMVNLDFNKAQNDQHHAQHIMALMADNHSEGKGLLMQYTGLKDKNGVEIYEGDIVKWTHLKHWWTAVIEPIESCPNGPLYAVERTNNMSVNDDEEYTYQLTHSRLGVRNELPFLSKSAEVIGNRFETPELLEDK